MSLKNRIRVHYDDGTVTDWIDCQNVFPDLPEKVGTFIKAIERDCLITIAEWEQLSAMYDFALGMRKAH